MAKVKYFLGDYCKINNSRVAPLYNGRICRVVKLKEAKTEYGDGMETLYRVQIPGHSPIDWLQEDELLPVTRDIWIEQCRKLGYHIKE